ncbi:hypothetical protein FE257_009504 [Aspergillus nanangensis]|uniref:Major facilitator superfamily (MFS) profile domain-containing protein n=1 Tax=Aspergillus nanangensis TaxID=2582783 RepID=A0AAD4CJT0_ASPNN|nr:hypothetical protein FE257_009504 [Aspergillus nanangensis]
MIAPALSTLGQGLHMKSEIEVELSMSIFILACTIGPLVFGPASELYGRVRLFYFDQPVVFGVESRLDVWSAAEERGKAMGIYTLAPILGPVVGPIAGGFIAEHSTWRWVFWYSSIAAGLIQIVGFIWLRESHPGTLLRRQNRQPFQEAGPCSSPTDAIVRDLANYYGHCTVHGLSIWDHLLNLRDFPEYL